MLRWDLSQVKNLDELYVAGKKNPMGGWRPASPGEEKDGDYLNPITDALIWLCLAIELGRITASNVDEFFARVRIWERITGPMLSWGDGKKHYISRADILRHVGMTVNVADKTRAFFMKKVAEKLDEQLRTGMDSYKEEPSLFQEYRDRLNGNLEMVEQQHMKVVVKGNSRDNMEVTFFITSAKEKASFHDHAAISLCDGPHKFLAHIFSPEDKSPVVEYNIPIKAPLPG